MQNFQKIAITVAFSFTCFSVPVWGASVGVKAAAPAAKAGASDLADGAASASKNPRLPAGLVPGTGVEEGPGSSLGLGVDRGVERPGLPDWKNESITGQIGVLKEQYQKALREYKDLQKARDEALKQAKEVGKEERDKVREQYRVKIDELRARQAELRKEYRAASHPDHSELIDATRERAKETVRERRGHGSD